MQISNDKELQLKSFVLSETESTTRCEPTSHRIVSISPGTRRGLTTRTRKNSSRNSVWPVMRDLHRV